MTSRKSKISAKIRLLFNNAKSIDISRYTKKDNYSAQILHPYAKFQAKIFENERITEV